MAGVYSVSQVNSYIKNMFAQDFLLRRISVKGEVSNCKYHSSGHIYFTLKDSGGTLSAVMWASQRKNLKFKLADGQQVVVTGTVDVYERDGRYQLYASGITLDGSGALYMEYERRLKEFEEMGMFAPEYKRPIPAYARTVGIVTAPTGAAVRDIITVAKRRNPYISLILYPALVQGDGAKESIVKGLQTLDAMGLDVIIVGRGGGSIEDLWAFNEEEVARAIFACETPVISAVGHETDTTIADYVADLRAPTPSAAAELAVFDYARFESDLEGRSRKLAREMTHRIDDTKRKLRERQLKVDLYNPVRRINEQRERLSRIEDDLLRIMTERIADDSVRAARMSERLDLAIERSLDNNKKRLAVTSERLWGLSPLKKLSRGYGFVTDTGGDRIESVKQVVPGDDMTVRVTDGKILAEVKEIKEEEIWKTAQ